MSIKGTVNATYTSLQFTNPGPSDIGVQLPRACDKTTETIDSAEKARVLKN